MSYTTTQGQTWDMIAKEVYNDEKKAGYLMKSNTNVIGTFVFSTGTILNTPALEDGNEIELPPWRG